MELMNLDLNLVYVPQDINELLVEVSKSRGRSQRLFMLDDYCKTLEDEVKKIEGFRRELPLCMHLLDDAIDRLKKELMRYCLKRKQLSQTEKSMSLSGNSVEEKEVEGVNVNDSSDKREWLSSVQLWGSGINNDYANQDSPSEMNLGREEGDQSVFENPTGRFNNGKRDEPFVTIEDQSCFDRVVAEQEKEVSLVLGYSGTTPASKMVRVKYQYTPEQLKHASKKARRSWPPEIHRRFLEAIDELGGWQAATPKKIREVMQMEGLTTDEVKSHLQKYRLHIRSSSVAQANMRWMVKDGYENQSNLSINTRSDSPQIANASEVGQEDDRSYGHCWNGAFFMVGEVDVQS